MAIPLAVPELGKHTATGRALDGMPEAIELRLFGAHWRAADHLPVGHQGTASSGGLSDLHLNRFDRVPALSTRGHDLRQLMQEKLIEHEHDVGGHGENLPEIRAWRWGPPA